MNNTNPLLITVLLVSAAILGVMLIGSLGYEKASASSSGDRTFDRDFIIVTGQISKKVSILYVIHAPTRMIFAYVPDAQKRLLTLTDMQKIQ